MKYGFTFESGHEFGAILTYPDVADDGGGVVGVSGDGTDVVGS